MPQTPLPIDEFRVDALPVAVYGDMGDVGAAAAAQARSALEDAIAARGVAHAAFATGNSQSTFFRSLRELDGIDWSKVTVFLVDQYLGVDPTRRGTLVFLEKHFLDFVRPRAVHPVSSDPADPERTSREFTSLLQQHPLDLATLGWGENGHLAFNDPHNARFDDPAWVKVVTLSDRSRRQPVAEGRFASLDEVPTHAVTMTIPALLSAKRILCIVPEGRKAEAVRACIREPVSEERPGSVLRTVDHAQLFLDRDSAALLSLESLA